MEQDKTLSWCSILSSTRHPSGFSLLVIICIYSNIYHIEAVKLTPKLI